MTAARIDAKALRRNVLSTDTLDLVPRLTLLLVLPVGLEGLLLAAVVLVATVVLLDRRLYRSPYLWLAIAMARGVHQLLVWRGLDDHRVLITYWCLALALAFFTERPRRLMRTSGRVLVGLVMAFAALWKLVSPEYLDGRFFHFTLLVDPRFEPTAKWIGGISADVYAENLRGYLAVQAGTADVVELAAPARITPLAWILTIGTVAMEGGLAALFLTPLKGPWAEMARAGGILVFCFVTYLLVPVVLFGAILAVMTLATCDRDAVARRWLVAAFVLLLVWTPVWHGIAAMA